MHVVPRKIEKKAKRIHNKKNYEKHKVRGKVSKEFYQIKKSENILKDKFLLHAIIHSFIYICAYHVPVILSNTRGKQ